MEKTILTKICGAGHFGESPHRKSKYLTSTLTWFILVGLFLTLTSTLTYAEAIGKITAVEGNVDIMKPGQERVVPGRLLAPVSEGDIVRTKSSGKAEITFDDESIIRLAPNTRLQITEYLMEGSKRKSGVMNLFRGKIRAVVSKSRKIIGIAFGEGERFEVRTPTAVAGVKGTDFFVTYALGITGVMVADGKIDVFNPAIPGQVVLVTTGNATTIAENQPPQTPRPVSDVEKIRHTRDTDPAEKPKDKDDEDETMVATATTEGVFGYEVPDEGTLLTASGGFADAEPDAIPVTETHPELLADIIPPSITLNSSAFPEAGNLTSAIFLFSSNEPATYSYNLINVTDGTSSGWTSVPGTSLTLTGLLENSYILDVQATDLAGNVSTPASLSFDLSRYSLSGFSQILTPTGGQAPVTGEVAGVSNQNWGGWNTNMVGGGTNPATGGVPPSGTLFAGGTSTDTLLSNNGGYWLETLNFIATGTNLVGDFSGTSTLKYLSPDRLGTGTGSITGTYDETSTQITDSGTYTETSLAWSGQIDYDSNDFGLYYSNVDGIWGAGDTYNFGNNLIGGTQSPWSGTTSLTLMGLYVGPLSTDLGPFMWNAPIYSWNVNTSKYLTYDGGAFWGLTGGVWKDMKIDARVYSLYIDPSGNAGILIGSVTGGYYPELMMFEADGTWTPTVLATGLSPASLGSLTYSPDISFSYSTSTVGGFTAGGFINGNYATGLKYSISGQDWGIWQTLESGAFSGGTSDTWSLSLNPVDVTFGTNPNIIVGTQTYGTQWSNGMIAGQTYGYGADITTTPMTWISVGETIGTFDPSALTWQAVQTGAWLETAKFLGMACPGGKCNTTGIASTADEIALKNLNIPFAEVGKADLSGSGTMGGLPINVNMTGVTFFAYQSGDAPKIWATGSVSGDYECSACGSTIVGLTSTTGGTLTANFNVQTFDTSGQKWTATVDGSGTLSGGSYNGSTTFNGAAAGTNGGTGPSTFSGTAAGTAQ